MLTRILSPAAEAPCHHLCPADFFWSQKYKQIQPHALVLDEPNITSFGTCNIFLTMTVNAISPKYCPPRMSASAWSLPTGSKSSGREQYSLRFAASLGGKTEASSKEGQHECMLCNISFYLIPTLAKPMSRKYNVVPIDPLLMMVSPFENACTWSSWNVKCLDSRCNPLTCTNAIAVSYPQTLDALVHKLIIKTIEEPKLRPTGLQELHISSWENDSLEGNKPSLILLTSLIKQLKDTFLAVWVVLQTKSENKIGE